MGQSPQLVGREGGEEVTGQLSHSFTHQLVWFCSALCLALFLVTAKETVAKRG